MGSVDEGVDDDLVTACVPVVPEVARTTAIELAERQQAWKIVNPIVDQAKYREPLCAFDAATHSSLFGISNGVDAETLQPVRPANFDEPYLYPSLTRDEYARLTLLWYHTRGIHLDGAFTNKIDQILKLFKESYKWEFAIVGIVDNQHFTRFATTNIPIARIPRRESTCSHTIHIEPGTVLAIKDLSNDWRYQNSPAVKIGGLRSYAGTPICIRSHDSGNTTIGSLCIASNTIQPHLQHEEKVRIVKAADLIAAEFAARTRSLRVQARQDMNDCLFRLRDDRENVADPASTVITAIKGFYPDSHVGTGECDSNTLKIRGFQHDIDISQHRGGIWENTSFIRAHIQSDDAFGDDRRPIRGVFAELADHNEVLVVASSELRLIFDEVDAWFIDRCAQYIVAARQRLAIRRARATKDFFLRSITHELRTPVHGILSSAELLEEILDKSTDKLNSSPIPNESPEQALQQCIATIKHSSEELMTTINSVLKYNLFAGSDYVTVLTEYDLCNLEGDVLGDVLRCYRPSRLRNLSVRFEQELDAKEYTVQIDATILRELMKCLVMNAVDATTEGTITVSMTLDESRHTLTLSVVDNGIGICPQDQARIFNPFEKIDPHGRGIGLGLSLAQQMATFLKGSLQLVNSALGQGSHFELCIPDVECVKKTTDAEVYEYPNMPKEYFLQQRSQRKLHQLKHLEQFLQEQGFVRNSSYKGAVIITNEPEPFTDCQDEYAELQTPHIILQLVQTPVAGLSNMSSGIVEQSHVCKAIHGPLYRSRLHELMLEADTEYGQVLSTFEEAFASRNESDVTATTRVQLANMSMDSPIGSLTDSKALVLEHAPSLIVSNGTIKSAAQSRRTSGQAIHALLVDDNPTNLLVLEMYCKKRLIPYTKAINGSEAVKAFVTPSSERISINLILLDLQMPIMDGFEACRQIRAFERDRSNSNASRSAIFMVTGQDSPIDRKNSLDAGADEFFTKPVSLKVLDKAIAARFSHFDPKGSAKNLHSRSRHGPINETSI